MVENDHASRLPKPGYAMRLLTIIAGVDEDTLRNCPQHDWDCVRASALLFVAVWIYQTGVFSVVGHYLFARDGQFHVLIALGAAFIATFILALDSWVFNRACYYRDGLYELKRAGLDLGGGFFAAVKAVCFLGIRILVLSLPMAQLTAIFFGLAVFHADIVADQDNRFRQQNGPLIEKARAHVDAETAAAGEAVSASQAQIEALQKQVAVMRDGAVDAMSNDPAGAVAVQELQQLMAEKARRERELEAAQKFASAELAGERVETGNTGRRGRGPVRIAAEERVHVAAADVRRVDEEIAAARSRFDGLNARSAKDRSQKSSQLLPDLQRDLNAESKNLIGLRQHLTELTDNRDQEIRDEAENDPGSIKDSVGFLGQLRSLRQVAKDPEIAAIIFLIDVASFGLELAAVLAKVTTYVPMEYTARLARNAYVRVLRLAQETDAELNDRASTTERADIDELPPVSNSSTDRAAAMHSPDDLPSVSTSFPTSSLNGGMSDGFAPPKRSRGRPRKYPPPVTT